MVFNSHLRQSFDRVPRAVGDIDSEWALFHSAIVEVAVASCGCKVAGASRGGNLRTKQAQVSHQGQSDLLRGAKMDSLDALRQLALACEACGLTSSCNSSSSFSNAELHFSTSGRRSSTHNNNGRI